MMPVSSIDQGRGERGAAVIEFALIASLMVTLLFGVMTYGEILADYVQLRYRLGELSRQVSVGEDAADRQEIYNRAIAEALQGFMQPRTGCAGPTFSPLTLPTAGQVTITVTFSLDDSCRIMPEVLPIPDELSVDSTFTVPAD
ncbi:TadE/TadG family type IV pilus assembly protein [Oleomonas cavernae]|nr:TadE/TadG family type IV pilus assembly protein [Oleomonas cavernae]